eukprot:INCI18181.1.p1 GENE.INCI18181.1~~INCI18181.1.p1  ORF type:complete len:415 (+),score=74.02 INCI18181.1:233-1477(+)
MPSNSPISVVSDTMKDWYKGMRKRVESTNEESMTMIKFAAGTVAVGSAVMIMYRVFGTSERGLKQKMKHSRLRLLSSRRNQQQNVEAGEEAGGDRAEAESSASSPGRIFNQFRDAYVEDKELQKHTGGCHCGRVRFIVEAPHELECIDSDRNMYTLKGRFPHLVVPKSRVVLLTSSDNLQVYHFGNMPVGPVQEVFEFQNLFCKNCGVHCFGYNKAKDTMHVNSMCLDMDTVHRVSVAFESERSSWRVMNPLLYQPSIGEEQLNTGVSQDNTTGTYLPTPWKAASTSTPAYDDLNHLSVAAGAHFNFETGKHTGTSLLAPLPAKPEPLYAFSESARSESSKKLFDEDDDDSIDEASTLFLRATSVDDNDDDEGLGGDSPLTQLFSVERLRLHLRKHVQDESALASSDNVAVSMD